MDGAKIDQEELRIFLHWLRNEPDFNIQEEDVEEIIFDWETYNELSGDDEFNEIMEDYT